MTKAYKSTVAASILFCILTASLASAISNGEKVKISGLITGRTGESLTVKTASSNNVVVVLTNDTRVAQPRGVFGFRKKEMTVTTLIPGLKVEVQGVGQAHNRVIASVIKFSADDLQTAETIQAGLAPTRQAVEENQQNIENNSAGIQAHTRQISSNQVQLAANRQQIGTNAQDIQDVNKRFAELSEYDTKYADTVNFAVGSSVVSDEDKMQLMQLAHNAVNLTGYLIEVKGYASSSGSAAINQQLSMERAQVVVAYLLQECNVPVRHIIAPGAMGVADPAASNETSQGRAENRRVEVKVLMNRGLQSPGN